MDGEEKSSDKGQQPNIDSSDTTAAFGKTDDDDSPFFYAEAKQKFSFVIPYEQWQDCIEIKEDSRGDRYLGGKWTTVFLDKLQEINPTCPLVFKGNRVKREKTRTTKAPFFRGKVICMFPGCVRYNLVIKRAPIEEKRIKVKVRTIPPNTSIKHEKCVLKGRHISGTERESTAEELKNAKPSQVYYKRLGEVSGRQYNAGNVSNIGTKGVLQKISSEASLAERLHKDVITELALQKEIYDSLDDDAPENAVKGCIQYLSTYPFCVHVYSAKQLEILASVMKEGSCTLYFDATGKVVSKIPDQNKRVYYYPVLLKGLQKGDPPVPVAEMISNSHNTTDVSNFFLRLFRDLHVFKPNSRLPKRMEIDFSWAFLHGILMAVNREDLDTYLHRAWNTLHEDGEWGEKMVVHICAAHLLHNISEHLGKEMKIKPARKYIKHVMGLMINTTDLKQLEYLYRNLSIVLLSPTETSHTDYEDAKASLDMSILNQEACPEIEIESEDYSSDHDDTFGHGRTIFYEHFNNISESIKADMATDSSGPDNFLFCPSIQRYISKTYMSISPLWTGLLLEDSTRDTNSSAEYWMKIVKKDILNDKQRLRPALFIRRLRPNINGRLREFERKMSNGQEDKPARKKKKTSFDNAQETWGGKKRKPKKGIYFKSPKELPTPKKKKSTEISERALHWGGRIAVPHGEVQIQNTCTVDNMLVFISFLLDLEHVQTWFQEHANTINVCRSLLEIKALFQSGNWNEGRALWLVDYCSPPINHTSWNLYGSEAERFVVHLAFQESVVQSRCSKRLCLVKNKRLCSTEILLGDKQESRKRNLTLQDSLSQWEAETEIPCSDGQDGRCRGMRSYTARAFSYGTPPILVVSVSFLSQMRGLTAAELTGAVTVIGKRYRVFGYTMNSGAHFKGHFLRDGKWLLYDGLNNPEIQERKTMRASGTLEHVVLVVDEC